MKGLVKCSVVLAGYAAAVLVASAAVYVRLLNTQGPAAQASAGMYAFGDLLLFVAAFGGVALFPTGLAFYFLRPYRWFWTLLSLAALAIAVSGAFAASFYVLAAAQPHPGRVLMDVAALSVLRMLGSPLVAGTFLIAAFLAPTQTSRWALLAATGIECVVAAYSVLHWFAPFHGV